MLDDEEIFTMKTGEDLNEKVSEKVMDGVYEDYSGDISYAWKVVKRLTEMNWRIDIMSSADLEHVSGVKMVDGTPVSLNFLADDVKCDNLPEAVCKAALLIVNNSDKIDEIVSRLSS